MRGFRHRIEDARDECAAAVEPNDTHLEALAGGRLYRRNGGMPSSLCQRHQ